MLPRFDPQTYGPVFAPLLQVDRRRPLDAGDAAGIDPGLFDALSIDTAFGHTAVRDRQAALSCLAGCWLLADNLQASHSLSQSLPTAAGSWWHGIMHRREGDFGNAKYWMRQADWPPALDALAERTGGWDSGGWDSVAFIDRCQQALRSGDAGEIDACLDLQQTEWETLFDACYAAAIG